MSDRRSRLADDRAARDAARQLLDSNLKAVADDLKARGIGGRMVDSARDQATETAREAMTVARESKGIIALTLAALAAWFARKPLLALLLQLDLKDYWQRTFHSHDTHQGGSIDDD